MTGRDPVRLLEIENATALDITFLEQARSNLYPDRAYLIGIHEQNWYVSTAIDGDPITKTQPPTPVTSKEAAKQQAELWERGLT